MHLAPSTMKGVRISSHRSHRVPKASLSPAIDYVLANWFRHAGREVGPYDLDRLSSAADRSLVVRPQTWLLRVGWEAV